MHFSVRRLAVLDLVGPSGQTGRRALVVRAEFIAAALTGLTAGIWSWAAGAPIQGVVLFGVGSNYLPLAAYAVAFLRRPQRPREELAADDVRRELRSYTAWQLLLAVPYVVAAVSLLQYRRPRPQQHGIDCPPADA